MSRSAHTFVLFHEALQNLFVFPFIRATREELHLAIDDSTLLAPANTKFAQEYEDRYRVVVTALGLGMSKFEIFQ